MKKSNINECPYCGSIMELSEAPFIYHGSYLGLFEAYICHNCRRVYFTERAYREIMRVPISLEDFTQFEDQSSINQTVITPSLIVSKNKLEVKKEITTIIEKSNTNVNTNIIEITNNERQIPTIVV